MGKVRAFAHLTEREKCDVLNSLTGPTAKRFHPNKGPLCRPSLSPTICHRGHMTGFWWSVVTGG